MKNLWLTVATILLFGSQPAAADILSGDIKGEVASGNRLYLFELLNSTELSASVMFDASVFNVVKENLEKLGKSEIARLTDDSEMLQVATPIISECGADFGCRLVALNKIFVQAQRAYDGYLVVRADKVSRGCKVDMEVYVYKKMVRRRSSQTGCRGADILQAVRTHSVSIFENVIRKDEIGNVEITFGSDDAPVKTKLWLDISNAKSIALLKELTGGWAKKNEKKIQVMLRFIQGHSLVEAAYCTSYLGNLNGYLKTSALEKYSLEASTADWADALAAQLHIDRKKMRYCMMENLFDRKVSEDYQEIYKKLERPNTPVLTTNESILEKATLASLEGLIAAPVAASPSTAKFQRQVIKIE